MISPTALLDNSVFKYGIVVTLYVRMYTNKTNNDNLVIGQLPSDCRPSRKIIKTTNITSPIPASAINFLCNAYLTIETNGNVYYAFATNAPNAEIYNEETITFII